MIIKRTIEGKEYEIELTPDEISKVNAEHVTNWMESVLINDFGVNNTDARDVAESAYDIYCEGNGETEYECVEIAYNRYCNGDE